MIYDYLYLHDGETAGYYYNLVKEKLSNEDFELVESMIKGLNVSNEMLLDAVHAAVLIALLDPESIVEKSYDPASISKYYEESDFNSMTEKDGIFEEAIFYILDEENGADVAKRLMIVGDNDPHIYIKIVSENKVAVWFSGHDELNWDTIFGEYYEE